jgi:histidine triad (HIT) family protein
MIVKEDPANCIFCQIIKGESPVSLVYEDDKIMVFPTIEPITLGHLLIIPKLHAPYLEDLEQATAGLIMTMAARLASAIRKSKYKCDGINIFVADGEVAGQDVFHFHLHVFPRFEGDGFGLKFDPAKNLVRMERAKMNEIAGEIRWHFLRDKKEETHEN